MLVYQTRCAFREAEPAKEPGLECMTPLDVLASIHFQWVMHDESHRAERQARRPINVGYRTRRTFRAPDQPILVSQPCLQQEDILIETRLSNLKTPQMTMLVNEYCLLCPT
jgi:hypothetical protein